MCSTPSLLSSSAPRLLGRPSRLLAVSSGSPLKELAHAFDRVVSLARVRGSLFHRVRRLIAQRGRGLSILLRFGPLGEPKPRSTRRKVLEQLDRQLVQKPRRFGY